MGKRTPGPWEYKMTEGSDGKRCTVYGQGRGVARHVLPEDARLIAAAPEMLNTLVDIARYLGGRIRQNDGEDLILYRCRAAIAKTVVEETDD